MDLSSARDFPRFFRVILADTPELQAIAFGVRYRVYCLEFGYEPKGRFADEQEVDEYDETSLHALIVHKASGQAAGCVRLVPAVTADGDRLLPFEKHCRGHIDHERIKTLHVSRETVCEISRLAVDRGFRRRKGEELTRFGYPHYHEFTDAESRTLPLIAVSAYLAVAAMTDLTGWRNAFAMMEPFLPRLLTRVGIHFVKVGDALDYHGFRAPYFNSTDAVLKSMSPELKELYHVIHRELDC